MPAQTRSQSRTPFGGMNQDDSLITPSRDSAGRNAFELNDYRYALNARIGSSRSNNIGDLETIKDTSLVTDYSRTEGGFTNPNFIGSLAPWLQIDQGAGLWQWSGGQSALIAPSTTGDILYQPVSFDQANVRVRYRYIMYGIAVSGFILKLIYLTGTTIIGTEDIDVRTGGSSEYLNGDVYVTVPDGCDGVGIQAYGTAIGISIFALFNFQVYGFVSDSVPSGTEKVIGRLNNSEFQRIYFAVYNSEGNHSIRYYDRSEDAVYELITWSGFNWLSTTFVSMAMIDNWLALTDRRNRPWLMDVDTIGDTFFNLGNNFREFHISFHKWAPVNPPIPRVYYDTVTNNFDKLKNKAYQFATRINYKGNLKSRYSPISKAAITSKCGNFYDGGTSKLITSIEVDIAGSFLDEPGAATEYNYFGHDDIKFTEAAESIDIVYRESTVDIWKKWKTVSMESYARFHYFDGNANQTPLPVEDFIQPFDTVPFLAGVVEAIDNRFVFADCLDELDPATTITPTEIGFVTDPSADWNDSFAASFPQFSGTVAERFKRLNALSDSSFKYRAIIKAGFQYFDRTGWRSAVYTDDAMTFLIDFTSSANSNRIIGLNFKIPEGFKPPEWAVGYQIMRTNTLNMSAFMYGIANRFIPLIDAAAAPALSQASAEIRDRVNEHFQNARIVVGERTDIQLGDVEFSEQLQEYLLAFNIKNGIGPDTRLTQETLLLANASRIYIDINNWYNASKATATADNPMNKLFYNFRFGDRVRFVGSSENTNPTSGQTKIYDLPILEFTGSGIIVEKPSDLLWVSVTSSVHPANNFSIEIYSSKTPSEKDHTYWECGEWYPVLFPGTEQRAFSKTDWVYTNNPAVTQDSYGPFDVFHKIPLYYGDVFNVVKVVYRDSTIGGGATSNGISASMSPDPDQTFDLWNNNRGTGRPALGYRSTPVSKFKATQLRFGGKIVEESFINSLNRMRDEDQFIYPSEYGRVRALVNTTNAQVESVGSILLAIGERETWSIYVNRTTLEDLSGRSQVALSDKVLGSYNTLLGSHGTLNPESVSLYDGRVVFWNAFKGAWIRYGRDGLTDIAAYKMRNWFRELGDLLYTTYMTDTPAQVVSEYDEFNDEVVTFINHSSLPETFRGYSTYKGALFSEEDVRWKSVHSFQPEMMGKLGNQLYFFKGGTVYKSEKGTGYSTFFGTKYNVQWEPVFNDDKDMKKVWLAIAQVATHKWSVERMLSEYRGAKTIQQTVIPLANFEEREDNYYAAIGGDQNTPVVNPVIDGARMRSKAIQVLMQLDPAVVELSLMHYAFAICDDSPKNP